MNEDFITIIVNIQGHELSRRYAIETDHGFDNVVHEMKQKLVKIGDIEI